MNAIVFGGYGVFGSLVARGLADTGIKVTIAGRDEAKARAMAASIKGASIAADVHERDSCARAVAGQQVVVNCSGPFNATHTKLLEGCLAAGVHYVDIADDRQWCRRVYESDASFRQKGLTLAWGCSSFPGISGALAAALNEHEPTPPDSVRCSLFIGNRNPKGYAAVRSAVGMIGRKIQAPQGILRGWSDLESVELPLPFGRRKLLNAEAPDYDLMPKLLGVKQVVVKAGFELPVSNLLFRLLAACGPIWGAGMARLLWLSGKPLGWIGGSGGAITCELTYGERVKRGSASGEGAQKLAAWPAILVARALCEGQDIKRGAVTAFEAIGTRKLLAGLQDAGFQVRLD